MNKKKDMEKVRISIHEIIDVELDHLLEIGSEVVNLKVMGEGVLETILQKDDLRVTSDKGLGIAALAGIVKSVAERRLKETGGREHFFLPRSGP